MLTRFTATATTCAVAPGTERMDDSGVLHVKDRVFSDIVESPDERIAGVNEPTLSMDINTRTGEAVLNGRFALVPSAKSGSWEGELHGSIADDGMVRAFGLAQGQGEFEGLLLRVDFRQVEKLATPAPCTEPKAFFEIEGWILER
jgi:hypothetical protein